MLSVLRGSRGLRTAGLIVTVSLCSCAALACGFWLGKDTPETLPAQSFLPPLQAASAAASDTMAVATGPISEDAEGIFFLDFITGDLRCLVYYPRWGTFGAQYYWNVTSELGGAGKNSQYIMVTGGSITRQTTGAARPGASLVYVTEAKSGKFAAYAVPWNRTLESAGTAQRGQLIYAGGGYIRNFQISDPKQGQPNAVVDPNQP